MEGYIEQVVPQKMDVKLQAKRFLFTVLPMMVAMILLLSDLGVLNAIKFLFVIAILYVSYRLFMSFDIEWEYVFVTNEVQFAKISNKSKRKEMLTCLVKDTVVLTRVEDKSHYAHLLEGARKVSFCSNTDAQVYVWILQKNGKKTAVYFEPEQTMLQSISTLARNKVFF